MASTNLEAVVKENRETIFSLKTIHTNSLENSYYKNLLTKRINTIRQWCSTSSSWTVRRWISETTFAESSAKALSHCDPNTHEMERIMYYVSLWI